MQIEFLKPWRVHDKGAVVEMGAGIAESLIQIGVARVAVVKKKARKRPPRDKRVEAPERVKHGIE